MRCHRLIGLRLAVSSVTFLFLPVTTHHTQIIADTGNNGMRERSSAQGIERLLIISHPPTHSLWLTCFSAGGYFFLQETCIAAFLFTETQLKSPDWRNTWRTTVCPFLGDNNWMLENSTTETIRCFVSFYSSPDTHIYYTTIHSRFWSANGNWKKRMRSASGIYRCPSLLDMIKSMAVGGWLNFGFRWLHN